MKKIRKGSAVNTKKANGTEKSKGVHKSDPKRVAAAKLAWSRGPKLLKIAAKAAEKRKNAKLSKKVIKHLPATIKAVENKIAAKSGPTLVKKAA